jgi:uncharacterized protein (TIGR03032 family)
MADASPQPAAPFRYVHSPRFPELLEQLQCSLLVTTYQAGRLMVVRSAGGRLSTLLRAFERPMGLAVDAAQQRLALGTRRMLWMLRSEPDIAPQLEPAGRHDACFVPRRALVTGDMQGHEVAFCGDEVWIVNTRFSCLATLDDERYTFVPRWRPPFVDELVAEDRCHLNGFAIENGRVRYATAMGETNTAGGWRDGKVGGGVVVDVQSDEVLARGFAMPHSPRIHRGELFVLDSGRGALVRVDRSTGERQLVAELPGYVRGLAFHGDFAFLGLSLVREKDVFAGMPITERFGADQRSCGVSVVNLNSGKVVAFLRFEAAIAEIFDVQVLAGMRWPGVLGIEGDGLDSVLTAPPDAWRRGAGLPGV